MASSRASAVSRRAALASLALAGAGLLAGCGSAPAPQQVRGLVLSVQAATFTQIASFTLRAEDGTTLDFVVEENVGMTPSHLREHGALGEPVTVTFRRADGLLIATRIDD